MLNITSKIWRWCLGVTTEQKMKFSIKDFFSKCDQIHGFVRIWSNLLKKFLMESFIFCAVDYTDLIGVLCNLRSFEKETLNYPFWAHTCFKNCKVSPTVAIQ